MARIIQTEDGLLKTQYFIRNDNVSIGSSDDNQIQLQTSIISKKHAQIFIEKDHNGNDIFFLEDLNSINGCFINQQKINCRQLKHKDEIYFAKEKFTFIDDKVYLENS